MLERSNPNRSAAAAEHQRREAAEKARREAAENARREAAENVSRQQRTCGVFRNPFSHHGTASALNPATPALRNHVQSLCGHDASDAWGRAANAPRAIRVSMRITEPADEKERSGIMGLIEKTPIDDVAEAGFGLAKGAAGFAFDRARNVVDFVGRPVGVSSEEVGAALKFAAEKGVQLTGSALGAARGFARDAMDKGLQIGRRVGQLGVNDSYSIGGSASIKVGLGAGAAGGIEIKRVKDGYTVSGEMSGDVSAKLLVGVGGGAGTRVEFKFNNNGNPAAAAEKAERAALILAGAGAAVAAPPVLKPALMPSRNDLNFLRSNTSAVEFSGNVSAEVDARVKMGMADMGASAELKGQTTYRMEFEGGRPSALVHQLKFSSAGEARAALQLVKKFGGARGDELTAALNKGAKLDGSLTVETRIPLDPRRVQNLRDLRDGSSALAFFGAAETSIKASALADAGDFGAQGEIKLSGLSASEAGRALKALARGNVGQALRSVSVEASGSVKTFEDEGLNLSGGVSAFGVGIKARAYAEERDVKFNFAFGER